MRKSNDIAGQPGQHHGDAQIGQRRPCGRTVQAAGAREGCRGAGRQLHQELRRGVEVQSQRGRSLQPGWRQGGQGCRWLVWHIRCGMACSAVHGWLCRQHKGRLMSVYSPAGGGLKAFQPPGAGLAAAVALQLPAATARVQARAGTVLRCLVCSSRGGGLPACQCSGCVRKQRNRGLQDSHQDVSTQPAWFSWDGLQHSQASSPHCDRSVSNASHVASTAHLWSTHQHLHQQPALRSLEPAHLAHRSSGPALSVGLPARAPALIGDSASAKSMSEVVRPVPQL